VADSEPLSLRVKLSYGAPSFAGAAMAIPIGIHLTIFYSDVILVPLGFIALVKALARALDAITDPVMGWVTDRTRSRWGRRRPWILLGAPLAALAFFLMFTPPENISTINSAAWFAATYTLYYLFHTVYIIPHGALGPELTLDYHERSLLFGYREGFVVMGTMIAAILPPVLISWLSNERDAYSGFAALFGALLVLLYFNLVYQVKERSEFVQRESNPLIPGVRRVMRNRVFRLLLAVYLVGSITGAIPGLMIPYYTKYVLQPDDSNQWLAIFLFLYFGAGFLTLPIWIWAARRFEKRPVWLASFLPGFSASIGLMFLGPGDMMAAAIILVWAGCGFSAGLFLGPSMQADVIDYDELYTGRRREAQYGAMWSIMTKFAVIPSMSIPLAILASVGYEPNVVQTETVQFTIRAIFGIGPACTAFVAFCIAWFYPIDRRNHQRIWEGIRNHEKHEPATDPLTGEIVPPPTNRGVNEELGWYLDHFSLSELRQAGQTGPEGVIRKVLALALIALVLCCGFVFAIVNEVSMDSKPGLMAVIYVVLAGINFTAFCYHTVRFKVATRLAGEVSLEELNAHIEVTEAMKAGAIVRNNLAAVTH
jgi:GPH family glycoside/pentoside/hexuronide:cation symporter